MGSSGFDRRSILGLAFGAAAIGRARGQELREVAVTVSSTSFVLGGVRIGAQTGIFVRNGLRPRIVVMDSGNAEVDQFTHGRREGPIQMELRR